jgi:aspartate/methionine/tyrosine aminotransferase
VKRSRIADTAVPRLARGVARLGTESAFAVLARARELDRLGRSSVHLEIGEPDFPMPEHVADAGIAANSTGRNWLHAERVLVATA